MVAELARSAAGHATQAGRSPSSRAIIFQQLADCAARAIYGRVRAAVCDTLTPEAPR